MAASGDAAGAYLESLGRSDLATLSQPEWRQLIEIVVTGYCDTLRELAGHDRDRLGAMTARIPF
jgi:hypothetical protein